MYLKLVSAATLEAIHSYFYEVNWVVTQGGYFCVLNMYLRNKSQN